jgi:uncharacterized metal-binding protein
VSNDKKVIVIPCSGIGKPIGTVSRETTYEIIENLAKDKAETVCLAALTSGDEKTIEKVKNNYVITLDGCAKHCAQKNVEQYGKTPDKNYMILKFAAANPDKKPQGLIDIGNSGKALVDTISDKIAKDVEDLTKNKKVTEKENNH